VNVLMVSPGYPGEMPHFTRGLTAAGATVFGLGDQPSASLPAGVREALTAHMQVPDLWDEHAVTHRVREEAAKVGIDRVECLWEPAMILAARLREALNVPGLTVEQTIPFRDKESMKQVLDAAGIRTPWHVRATTADECRAAAAQIGYPLIIKPIAGAGATDTHRVDNEAELEQVLSGLRHVEQVSVEEFIEGEEFTFDTICAGGEILYENVARYRTRPLEERQHQWVSPSCVCLRELDDPGLADGRKMGRAVLGALGFTSGFSHMEWYRRPGGEVIFGEIGARPPGAHLVDAMNYASDIDLFRGWAEAVCHGRFSQPIRRRYNSAVIGKRAHGSGRIRRVEGVERLMAELGPHIAALELPALGSPRHEWRSGAPSDGFVIVRHPDLPALLEIADRVGRELQLYAE